MTNRPPDGEKGQEVTARRGEELEEQGTIDGQVAADTETNTSEKSASSNPTGRSTSRHAKDRGDEQSAIECQTATNNIRHDAPERSTDTETQEESESGVSDLLFRVAELAGERGKGKSDTLEPEAGETSVSMIASELWDIQPEHTYQPASRNRKG